MSGRAGNPARRHVPLAAAITGATLVAVATAGLPRAGSAPQAGLPAQAAFDRGNALYEAGDYEGAEARYRRALDARPESLPARYNLGNALYRQGRAGAALQQYLAVLRRAPRDPAARNNAAAARLELTHDLPPENRAVIAGPLDPPLGWLSAAETAWGALGALYLLAALAALLALRPRARPVAAVAAAVILMAIGALAAAAGLAWARRPEALVLTPTTSARTGPSPAREAVIALPEGAALRVAGERGGWLFVSLRNGLSGWVSADEVGRIP